MGNGTRTQLLRLVVDRGIDTRSALARQSGLAPSTVSVHVDALLREAILTEGGTGGSRGGRRPRLLHLHPMAGVVVGVDLGEHHAHLVTTDLAGSVLHDQEDSLDLADGPDVVLSAIRDLVLEATVDVKAPLRAVGIGVPGPVAQPQGAVVMPARMAGWHQARVGRHLGDLLGVPALVDNDANLLALGEYRACAPRPESMVVAKLGRGIGCGIVWRHELVHGASGAAGDISHTRLPDETTRCTCGKVGCLEAGASGAALVQRAQDQGLQVATPAELARSANGGDPTANRIVREGGARIGEALAGVIDLVNPELLVLGGALSQATQLVATVRTSVYEHALPLATADLEIRTAATGAQATALGAATRARDEALDRLLEAGGDRSGPDEVPATIA